MEANNGQSSATDKFHDENKADYIPVSKSDYEEDDGRPESIQMAKKSVISDLIGAMLALFFAIAMSTQAVAAQLLEGEIPALEVTSIRSAVTLPMIICWIYCKNYIWLPKDKNDWFWFVTDSALVIIWNNIFLWGVKFIPLASADTTYITTSIIATTILSKLFLKDKIDVFYLPAAVLCCVGITLVVQPEFLFHKTDHNTLIYENNFTGKNRHVTSLFAQNWSTVLYSETIEDNNFARKQSNVSNAGGDFEKVNKDIQQEHSTFEVIAGWTVMVICGIMSALIVIIKRGATLKNYKVPVWMLWNAILNCIVSPSVLAITGEFVVPSSWRSWLILSTLVFAAGSQAVFSFTALKFTSCFVVMIIGTTSTIFTLIAQYTITDYVVPGNQNALEISGAVIVFIGALTPPSVALIKFKCVKQTTGKG